MNLRIVGTREDFASLKPAWNHLAERMDGSEAFFRWEWCAARVKHALPEDEELFVVVAEEADGRTAGIAPLSIGRVGPWRGRVLRTLIGDHADYGGFLLGPEWNHHSLLGRIFDLLREHRHRWDVMHLLNFSSRKPQSFLIPEVTGDGLSCRFTERIVVPWLAPGDHPGEGPVARENLATPVDPERQGALRRSSQRPMASSRIPVFFKWGLVGSTERILSSPDYTSHDHEKIRLPCRFVRFYLPCHVLPRRCRPARSR